MKKRLLSLLSLAAIGSFAFGSTNAKIAFAANDYTDLPEIGYIDPASYFNKIWQDNIGAERISDRAVLVSTYSDWGFRGGITGRTYNMKNFDISIDASQIKPNTAMGIMIGALGTYSSEQGMVLNFDIVKSGTTENLYLVTCSTTVNGHNQSVPGFSNGVWEEDANYTGVQFTLADGIVNISLDYIDETTTKVTVNGSTFDVATADVYARFDGAYDHYVNIGLFNNTGQQQNYVIESVGDASDDVYFGETGAFNVVKNELNELKSADLSTIDNVLKAQEEFNAVPWSDLYSWDRAYMQADYDLVKSNIDTAIEELGNEVKVSLFETAVADLEKSCETLTTVEEIDNAIKLKETAEAKKAEIDAESLDGELKARYDAAEAKIATAQASIEEAAKTVLESSVVAYEESVKNIASAEDILNAQKAKKDIPTHYYAFITEEETTAYDDRISAADATLKDATSVDHKNWVQGTNALVNTTEDGSYQVVSYGDPFDTPENSNGLFNSEKISALDFETIISFDNIPQVTGSWVTFGLMEKPEMWINAEDDSVQNNKGIFFLISKVSPTKLSVQAFLCSLTSNRFYDSVLNQIIEIPHGQDIEVKFYTENVEVAGVAEEYFRMTFNGVGFDQEMITARKIKTVLGTECAGYFITATSGYEANDPALFTIKNINGKPTNSDSIAPEVDLTPTSTDKEKTFVNGSEGGIVTFNLDTKGQELTSVKVDGTAVEATNYTFDASKNKLTFNNAYLNTLTVGDHTVTAETAEGSVTWTLHVTEGENPNPNPNPEPGDENNVNVGLIVGLSVGGVVVVGGVVALVLFLIKRKKGN